MFTNRELYPLTFEPIYKSRIWGGTQLSDVLHRDLPESTEPIGEAWEIVDRDEAQSVVKNGPLAGKTLAELVKRFGSQLIGRKNGVDTTRFPLLVKMIDAGDRLSLQVHPDERACARLGEGAEPKTEMWYLVSSRPGARILAGLDSRATRQQLIETLNSSEVENYLQVYPSQAGDAYFITSGTLHAIDAGNLILEIQQNSDTTYRASDWGRVDSNGQSRELHVEKALASIDFMNRTSPRIPGVVGEVPYNRKYPVVNRCRFFSVDSLHLIQPWRDNTDAESFHLISAINRPVGIGREGQAPDVVLAIGETALLPAAYGSYVITPTEEGQTNVVKCTL